MSRVVKGDRFEARPPPGLERSLRDASVVEGAVATGAPDDEFASRSHLVLDEDAAQSGRNRYLAPASPALWLDERTRARIPRSLHADDPGSEIDIRPPEAHELAPPQTGIERESPKDAIARLERGEEGGCCFGGNDRVAPSSHCGKPKADARIHCHIAIFDRSAIDDSKGHQRVANSRWVSAVGE